ncbi:MAG: sulfatase-like hydrolase/transferase [Pirellula sp.]|jgi:arylsulfatase A-like enzyme
MVRHTSFLWLTRVQFAICLALVISSSTYLNAYETTAIKNHSSLEREGKDNRKPNIVFVLIDDMGWSDFSCFGNSQASTPNIDRIASEGIRFEQFYVNSPICSPSRCAILTSQYPQRWNIHSFLSNRDDNNRRGCANWLDPAAPMLPRIFQQHGYATGHFGKWHLGGQRDVDDAPAISDYGFDRSLTNFEGMGPKLLPMTLKPGATEPGRIWENAERLGGPFTWMQRSEITAGYTHAAIEFARQATAEGKPFFINVWPDDVHSPFWPPVEQWKNSKREQYLSVLEHLDSQLQELFEFLSSDTETRDNTLLFICSDNGPEPGAGRAGPFRNGKTTLYEGGIRSPLIVWGPGFIAPESRGATNTDSVFAAIDIGPSLLEICAITGGTSSLDGESVADSILGKSRQSRRSPIFWRRPPDRKTASPDAKELLPDLAMREGRWKLLCNYDGSEPQLYDLIADRSEQSNLLEKTRSTQTHELIFQRMKSQLLDWDQEMPKDQGPALGRESVERVRLSALEKEKQLTEVPLTFFATSDSHYEAIEKVERNDRNRLTIQRMNELPGELWPEKVGGGPITPPRGVLALGDLIDDGDKVGQTDIEWLHFEEQFGLDGTDGILRFPVFEGWGNHDGPPESFIKQRVSVQRQIRLRNQRRLAQQLISHVSPNGLHYAWDWNGIHFIQTNLYPADRQNPRVRYSLPWHDPQDALKFVKEDLARSVGATGRPVIIMAHCGFDTDWWVLEDWKDFYDAVHEYNLIAYFHGHSGTGVKTWKPEGQEKAIDIINTGQTEKGFFVIEITKERMRLGFHAKKDPTATEDLQWEWRYMLDKKIQHSK